MRRLFLPEKSKGMAEEKKDKAEYELDLANDCEWIRALDASGKPIRISKTDMAELIRANMPVVTSVKSGLVPAGLLVPIAIELEPNQTIDIRGRVLVYMDFSGGAEMSLVSFGYWDYRILHDSSLNSFISIRNKGAYTFEIKSISSSNFLFIYCFVAVI